MMAVFVIQKTSHVSNATTPLMVLLAVVRLFGAIPGHRMVTSSQHLEPGPKLPSYKHLHSVR